MKPDEGRLQTAEHILVKILEDRVHDAKVVIAKFEEDSGLLEISTKQDLRNTDKNEFQDGVNEIIERGLHVSKYTKSRGEVEGEINLEKIPPSVKDVRIVEINGFDKRPCKDPHVDNTNEIGAFKILKVERVGKDRYRFSFRAD